MSPPFNLTWVNGGLCFRRSCGGGGTDVMAVAPSLGASAYRREACLAARLPAERMCCQMGTVTKLCGTTGLWMTTARFVVGQWKREKLNWNSVLFFLENQTFWCIRFAVSLQKCISKSSRIFNPLSVFNLGPGRSEFSVTRHCSSGNLIRLDNNLFKGEEWTGPGAACDRRSFDHRTSSSEAVSLLWHLKQSHSFYVLTVGTANLDISLSI